MLHSYNMIKKILLNNKSFNYSVNELPCLIHGKEKMGASLFTMSLVADLYTQGYKLLCITGYPMAKDEFLSQTGAEDETISISNVINQTTELNKKALFVTKENPLAFIQLTKMMSDINERVILLKNIDLLNKDVFEAAKNNFLNEEKVEKTKKIADFLLNFLKPNFIDF